MSSISAILTTKTCLKTINPVDKTMVLEWVNGHNVKLSTGKGRKILPSNRSPTSTAIKQLFIRTCCKLSYSRQMSGIQHASDVLCRNVESRTNFYTSGVLLWVKSIREYLCHKWPQICSICCNHNTVLSLFMMYPQICNRSNTTGDTCGTETGL